MVITNLYRYAHILMVITKKWSLHHYLRTKLYNNIMTITSYSNYNSTPDYYITCECGCFIVHRNLSKHKKTKKHLNKING